MCGGCLDVKAKMQLIIIATHIVKNISRAANPQ